MHAGRLRDKIQQYAKHCCKQLSTRSFILLLAMARRDVGNEEFQLTAQQTALDAEWKRIQKKTFTRWCNEHLKHQQMSITDLETDLCDGVRLIVLVEVLSQKRIGRYSKKPRVYAQRMENVELALDFITGKERIRLVNIGGGDIVNGNLKLILGLIWTLILHYQISIQFNLDSQSPGSDQKTTPKHAILAFVQSKLPYENVTNLTTDWNDGTLIAKLVDAMAPGLCPEAHIMEPSNAFNNANTAMHLADQWLGIPQLLEAEDMVNPNIDELSMITYLSQYPGAKLKPGAPIKASGDPACVKVYGPGVEKDGLDTNTPAAEFTVDTRAAGMGKAVASVQSPHGPIECTITDNNDGTYTCSYMPRVSGKYTVSVYFAGKPAAQSPYLVNVAPGYDIGLVKAYGPGLQPNGVKLGDPGDFTIDASRAGVGDIDVSVDGPYWRGSKPQITDNKDGTYSCCYNPHIVGTYKVNISFANEAIPGSPFKVNVTDPSNVKISGPAVKGYGQITQQAVVNEEDGPVAISIDEPLEWVVDCTEAGPGIPKVSICNPEGFQNELEVKPAEKDIYTVKLEPEATGRYHMEVKYSGNEVKQSPIDFSLYDASKVKVTGEGLKGGNAGDILPVEVDTRGAGEGGLSISLIGPSQVPIDSTDHQDGTASLTFVPEVAGDYHLHVKFRGIDVPGSAFRIPVIDPTKVTASGSGVTGEGARVGAPAQVIVDTRDAGPAPVKAEVTTPSGEKYEVEFAPTDEEGVFAGEYLPKEPGHYKLQVTFADHEIPKSPFKVPICDPDAVSLSGTGLEYAYKDEDNIIDVATSGVGSNEVGCSLKSVDQSDPHVDQQVIPLGNNYECHFTPHAVGVVEGYITYCGFPVRDKLSIPVVDPSAVKVEGQGVESGGLVEEPEIFTIDATEAAPLECEVPLAVEVNDPDGEKVQTTVSEIEPNIWQVQYTPKKAGNYPVTVKYANRDVTGSPFQVPICDPDAVKAYGPGLERAMADEDSHFTVDASGAGEGALGLQIEGPADCDIDCKEVSSGIYEVVYVAPRPGIFHIHVKFSDQEISGSPFIVPCERPPPDASKCIISGLDNPGSFKVNGKDAGGNGLLEVGVCGAYLPANYISVKHNGDYTFSVSYDIPEPGETTITVKWHGQHLTGSPFTIITEDSSTK